MQSSDYRPQSQSQSQSVTGFPSVYAGRKTLYYENVPLWSQTYAFCSSDASCANAPSRPRCLGLQFPLACTTTCAKNTGSCLCTSAIAASR